MTEIIQRDGAWAQARLRRPTAPATDVPPRQPAKQAALKRR
ncbi:hypothetical protein ACWGDT_02525 [Streptomyces avermitilis]